MSDLKTIIVFLVIFSIIVIIHELGHFLMARKRGIQAREFAIGMGPKLFSTQDDQGTTYTLRMLPLGGYVRLAGLYEEEEIQPGMEVSLSLDEAGIVQAIDLRQHVSDDSLPIRVNDFDLVHQMTIEGLPVGQEEMQVYSVSPDCRIIQPDGTSLRVAPYEQRYEAASVSSKILTNVMGPVNNFLLSIVCFTLFAFLVGGIPSNENTVGDVVAGSPAEAAGLVAGDRIVSINDQSVNNWQELISQIQQLPGETVPISYERDGATHEEMITINKVIDEATEQSYGQIGIHVSRKTGFLDKLAYGFSETWQVATGVLAMIGGMFVRGFNLNNLGGPVAIAQMTGQVVQSGFSTMVWFLAMLSANIGAVNLFPIPALDGGKIVLNLIELVRGKPLSQSKEGIITLIGAVIMIILMIAVTWNDIMRAFF